MRGERCEEKYCISVFLSSPHLSFFLKYRGGESQDRKKGEKEKENEEVWVVAGSLIDKVRSFYKRTHSEREPILSEIAFYKKTHSTRKHILPENTFYQRTHSTREHILQENTFYKWHGVTRLMLCAGHVYGVWQTRPIRMAQEAYTGLMQLSLSSCGNAFSIVP